jgi:hypothetical protein
MENRELTATPTLGPSAGWPSATPRLLDLSISLPRNLTTEPGRRGLRKSAKLYERSQYVIENKERHIENELKTNSILSVFCANCTQKVRPSVKHAPDGRVVPGDAEGFRGGPRSGNRRMARKYKNRGNELKESLKTKDITFYCHAKRTQI